MNIEEFVLKYNGKKVDFDGLYGPQCVDLFRQYNREVWDNPHTGAVIGAKDLYLNYNKMPAEKMYLNAIPTNSEIHIGDVAIWDKTKTNQYGHVAIVLHNFKDSLIVFEQDGFKKDGAKISVRSKENLLGFLRKK